MKKIPLVYIHSAAHSGSTLLARQLARHPDVATVGELTGTVARAQPGYQCSCGAELVSCHFWQQVSAAMRRRGFSYSATTAETDIRKAPTPALRRLLKPLHHGPLLEAVRDLGVLLLPGGRAHLRRQQELKTALMESVLECTGKPVLVDSSKTGLQLKYHLRNPRLDVKVIWLVRDGRGVAFSITRNQGASLPTGARDWRRSNEEALVMARRLDPSRWMQVRYEALCAEPERTLEELWRFIGVAPRATEAAVPTLHVLGHPSRLSGAVEIRLNEKWRTALSPADLGTFEAVAGPLNRDLGYQ